MRLLGSAVLGVLILAVMGALVAVKRLSTGSVLDERPGERPLVRAVNAFNLAFLLVVNPVAAVLLLTARLEAWDPTHFEVPWPWLRIGVEAVGIAGYVAGGGLMMWALLTLRASYQLGGWSPAHATRW